MLAKGDIHWIQFEYSVGWIDSRRFLLDAFTLLLPHGYRIARLYPDGLQWITSYDTYDDNFRYANYVAISPKAPPVDFGTENR